INPDKVDGILINSTVSVILAFVASRINYSYQESRFIQIRKIEEQKIELEKKNESQDIVLKVVAHDLRNPLSNIIGFISVIRMKYADMNLTGYLDLMEKVSRGAIQIIQDLVEVIGLENNSNPLTFQKIELNQYIEQSIYMNQNMGAKKEIVLNFSPDKGAIFVNISPEKFSRVIENLLSNAIKFSNTKSEIRIIVKKESDKAKIIIQDFGIGIPFSIQKNLFQKFSNARRRGTEGEMSVGLGMYIVYEIVTLHRGKITFTSEEGKGTTFIIELPIII
ncbi:MAG TPA: HAMP domain-containing sensor histidine kinase, partial [Leptospiraceae bacterium]|nr:HAMP domain-containing sensor histidine kinase [Leptospiraceae bacterium]